MYERMNIEDWKAKKKNDRDAVLADQKQALQEVLQDGTHLTAYLLARQAGQRDHLRQCRTGVESLPAGDCRDVL
jgi:hypothetical protein